MLIVSIIATFLFKKWFPNGQLFQWIGIKKKSHEKSPTKVFCLNTVKQIAMLKKIS